MGLFDDNINLENYISFDIKNDLTIYRNVHDFIRNDKYVLLVKINDIIIDDWDKRIQLDPDHVYNIKIYLSSHLENFYDCFNFPNTTINIDLSNYINNNITSMVNAFIGLKQLKSINFGNSFKHNKIDCWQNTFGGCDIEEIDLSNVDFSHTNNMYKMFDKSRVKKIIFNENIDTSNVTSFVAMFNNCRQLKEIIGLENFRFDKAEDVDNMFYYCISLEQIIFNNPKFDNVTSFALMFNNCISLKEIKGLEHANFSKADSLDWVFCGCSKLKELDLSNTKFPSHDCSFRQMFYGCSRLKTLKINNLMIDKIYLKGSGLSYFEILKDTNKNLNIISENTNLKSILINYQKYGTF
jgi:uncharacterized protein YjbI with pentapeptide repeats